MKNNIRSQSYNVTLKGSKYGTEVISSMDYFYNTFIVLFVILELENTSPHSVATIFTYTFKPFAF